MLIIKLKFRVRYVRNGQGVKDSPQTQAAVSLELLLGKI
jgi:hypothetical protein